MFKLDYNITKINFYLYLYNNEIYNDEKMKYLKKILFNNKKIKFNIFSFIPLKMERDEEECSNTRCELYINKIENFLLYKYMADYYRKIVNNTANDVKLKMQMTVFTLKILIK